MSERISIQGFAGLPDVALTVKPINILIGPQAIGKSLCAKLLYYFKNFSYEILNAIENDLDIGELNVSLLRKFNEYFPPQSLGERGFSVQYELGKHRIAVSKGRSSKSNAIIRYPKEFVKEFDAIQNDLKQTVLGVHLRGVFDVRESFLELIAKEIDEIAAYSQMFIPAGRSFFANLQSSIFSFLSGNNSLDPFLREFGLLYERFKGFPIERNERKLASKLDESRYAKIQSLIDKILCGHFSHEKKGDYIYHNDKRKIPVMNSSSGQQEFLPLAVILRAIPFTKFLGMGRSIYIEEPEAHLFPNTQREIVELLAAIYNTSRIPTQIIVTTHSPYILTAINNLLQAGNIRETIDKKQQEELYKVVPADQMLDADDLTVYSLSESECVSIMDLETRLISTSVIDQVSERLAIQFDKLLNLEQ